MADCNVLNPRMAESWVETTTLPLPCRWTTEGCVEVLPREERREHEGTCAFWGEDVPHVPEEVLQQGWQGNPRLGLLEHVVVGLALCESLVLAGSFYAVKYILFIKGFPALYLAYWYLDFATRPELCYDVIFFVSWFLNYELFYMYIIATPALLYHMMITEFLDDLVRVARGIVG